MEIAMKQSDEEVVEIDASMRTKTSFEIVSAPRSWMKAVSEVPIGGESPKPNGAINGGR